MLLDRKKIKKPLPLKERPFRPKIHPMLMELFGDKVQPEKDLNLEEMELV